MTFYKRGQLGKIITSFPVMILIFLIMAVYLLLTGLVFTIKGSSVPSEISSVELEPVLLKEINIEIDKTKKNLLIFDAIAAYWNDKITIYQLGEELEDFMRRASNEDYCLAIAQGLNENPAGLLGGEAINDFFYRYKDGTMYLEGNIGTKPGILRRYEGEGLLNQISFAVSNPNRRIYVQYYYGRCLE